MCNLFHREPVKTVLLESEETSGRRFAVIENEFGEIGIDDKLIARREDGGKGERGGEWLDKKMLGSLVRPFLGIIQVRNWGWFSLSHHLRGDFDHDKGMRAGMP